MVDNKKDNTSAADFLQELREFTEEAIVANEPCPEGHRRDPGSGRCLPMGSMDHTAVTRSTNIDNGPEWRGKADTDGNSQETAVDADEMEERESCTEGTTFSFIQGKCVSLEEAERENSDEFAYDEDEEEEDAAAPGSGGHMEITLMQPEGRRDTVNHECPPNQIFDYKRRECIPLNKDTVMASDLDDEFKHAVARYISGKLAITSPDPLDSHYHLVTVDASGNGKTSISYSYRDEKSYYHSHDVTGYLVKNYEEDEFVSQHFGHVIPKEMWEYDSGSDAPDEPVSVVGGENKEGAAPITTKQRKALPTSSFGVPRTRGFPLDTCARVRNAMARFNQAKGLSSGEKATLKRKILAAAKKCGIKVTKFANANTDEEYAAVAMEVMVGLTFELNENGQLAEDAARITTKKRKALPSSSFGVPGKRKFPLDTCARVRNAMARFNQAKGLTASEKATLRRKILAAAKKCGIQVRNFAKAETVEDFRVVFAELEQEIRKSGVEERVKAAYEVERYQGPCPPGMIWEADNHRCHSVRGFVEHTSASHSEIIAMQPEGRRDVVGFKCPDGWFFDFGSRKCRPLDPKLKEKSAEGEEDAESRVLSPTVPGRPVRISKDCPPGTIWHGDQKKCIPLDSRKKTKSAEELDEEEAKKKMKKKSSSPDCKGNEEEEGAAKEKKSKKSDCPPGQFMNPITKKCQEKKGGKPGGGKNLPPWLQKKSKGEEDAAADMSNRDGLVPAPAGQVKLPSDCPEGTMWDTSKKTCTPLSSDDKNRPDGSSPQSPTSKASEVENQVENLSLNRIIQHLDAMIRDEVVGSRKEKAKVLAKDLPNAAFPPSLVSSTCRKLMHHFVDVEDPYDNETVDVSRLRNALARCTTVDGFSEKAVEDAKDHLLFHARALVVDHLVKK